MYIDFLSMLLNAHSSTSRCCIVLLNIDCIDKSCVELEISMIRSKRHPELVYIAGPTNYISWPNLH